jgi:hypothetical protein
MLTCIYAGNDKSRWQHFSENIKYALANDNPGVKLAMLKLIIRFGDKIKDPDNFKYVARLFNNSNDMRIRKTALIAMYKLNHKDAVDSFEQRLDQESDKTIREKMQIIVDSYQKDRTKADREIDSCYNICTCCNFVSLTY